MAFLFEILKLPDLSWSHYCELLYISDDSKSDFYEKEAIKASWLVRELKRQISVFHYSRDCCYRMAKLIKRKFLN
ncbi:DUF1016 N-terminal domain-containing protein [Holdemanella biformis]|uniref:DUF1016 N-terminal domain-containing protein n=1 Tax=Holdemanella biformis TaxID=1735 RepID=UPI003461514B